MLDVKESFLLQYEVVYKCFIEELSLSYDKGKYIYI